MLELLDSLVRKAYQFQQLAVFSKPTHEVSHLLSEFGFYINRAVKYMPLGLLSIRANIPAKYK